MLWSGDWKPHTTTVRLDFRESAQSGNPTLLAWVIIPSARKTGPGESGHLCSSRLAHTTGSFGTLMKANGEDLKTIQELLRHATFKVTADTYTQAVTPLKREAQAKVAKLILADARAAKPVTPTIQWNPSRRHNPSCFFPSASELVLWGLRF